VDGVAPQVERLLGREPTFLPHATEAVWELAAHRSLFIVQDRIAREPDERETYSNRVRNAINRDPDGNEMGFGGAPPERRDRARVSSP